MPFVLIFFRPGLCDSQLDNKRHIVRAVPLKCRFISADFSAFCAFMYYNKAFFCVGLCLNRLKLSTAGICSVPRVYINMERPQAVGAVISRGIFQRKHLSATMHAGKGIIVLFKSFLFHIRSKSKHGRAARKLSEKGLKRNSLSVGGCKARGIFHNSFCEIRGKSYCTLKAVITQKSTQKNTCK